MPDAGCSARGGVSSSPEALIRRAITGVTAAIVVMTFAFSLGNVTQRA